MAETKRGPGRPPGSKNKTTKDSASSAGKSASTGKSGTGSRAKEKAQEIQAKKKADKRVIDEIWAIITIAIGAFLIVATFTSGAGKVGEMIGETLKGIFGHMAYVLPFYLILFGVLLFARKTSHFTIKTVGLLLLTLLMMCTLNSMRYVDESKLTLTWEIMKGFYTSGTTLADGGFLGMILATLLIKWFGKAGCIIFTLVAMFICLLLIINTPVSRFFEKIGDKIEERKLIKQHAHLDMDTQDAQGVQVAMNTDAMKASGASRYPSPYSNAQSAPKYPQIEAYTPASGSGQSVPQITPPAMPAQGQNSGFASTSSQAQASGFSYGAQQGQVSGQAQAQQPQTTAQGVQAPKLNEAEPPRKFSSRFNFFGKKNADSDVQPVEKNSVLRYMKDDALFDRSESGTYGLEAGRHAEYGFGLDGGNAQVAGSAAGTGLGTGTGIGVSTGLSAANAGVQTGLGLGSAAAGMGLGATGMGAGTGLGAAATAAGATKKAAPKQAPGTPDKEQPEKISNKEAREAMLTAEEINTEKTPEKYKKPSVDLLDMPAAKGRTNTSLLEQKAMKLEETLKNFHVDARVINVTQGPTITRYEVQPAVGVSVKKIVSLSDDIALNLEARSIRIEAPIPGKSAVGIEVENDSVTMVKIREIIDSDAFKNSKSKITFAVGKDISGNAIVADLKSMPHLLIAGSTGSGKSVCINSIITSFIYKANPDEVKLILVDPKVVELGNYNGIPHLMIPVVTDPTKAAAALNWAVAEMTDRYKKFAEEGVRDLESYNEYVRANGEEDKAMPQVVIIIDELADLMMAAPSQIEESICRLAQMARAAGMHLIVATQRPSVDVITGVIKANIPSRIAFAVSSQVDSRTILDMQGAEKLVGKGDMLFNPMGMGKPIRVQGTFISDNEVHKVIEYVKGQAGSAEYNEEVLTRIERTNAKESDEDTDELLPDAIDLVVSSGQASVSMLQRRFRIGYNRAARIVDMMEARGIIGPQDGSRPRQVLMTPDELEVMKNGVQEEIPLDTDINNEPNAADDGFDSGSNEIL